MVQLIVLVLGLGSSWVISSLDCPHCHYPDELSSTAKASAPNAAYGKEQRQFSGSWARRSGSHTYITRASSTVLLRKGGRPSLPIAAAGIWDRSVSSPALMSSVSLPKTLTTRSPVLCSHGGCRAALLCALAGVGLDLFSHSHYLGAYSCLLQVSNKECSGEGIFPLPWSLGSQVHGYRISSVALTASWLAHLHPNNWAGSRGCPEAGLLSHALQPVRVRAISPTFVTSGPVLSPAADFNEWGNLSFTHATTWQMRESRVSSPEQGCFELPYFVLLQKWYHKPGGGGTCL